MLGCHLRTHQQPVIPSEARDLLSLAITRERSTRACFPTASGSAYDSSRAFTVISALNSFDTGHPVSAFFTAWSNFALSAPGTFASRSRWLFVMLNPSPTFSSEIVAVVSILSAFRPTAPSCSESAIVKQPACAAASNSSGFVPTPFSNRVLKEYCVCFSVPLSVEIVPLPVFRSPCHTALALRCIVRSFFRLGIFLTKIPIRRSLIPAYQIHRFAEGFCCA